MQAIILAGGFGTRLRSVIADVPKPMAPIHGKPFLAYLIDYLITQGITDVVLSVHYLREQIQAYFKSEYSGINVSYVVEDEPLGTGGAIMKSLRMVKPNKPTFVLNGDTFLKLNYQAMYARHMDAQANASMALRTVPDCSRYGVVCIEGNVANEFKEQGGHYPGLINAGVYLLNATVFDAFSLPEVFSFERDFLFPKIALLQPQAFIVDEYFIDIGVPEDYARACVDFM